MFSSLFDKGYALLLTLSSVPICCLLIVSCSTPSIIATRAIQQGDLANNQNNYELAITNYTTYLTTAPALGTMRNPEMEADVSRKLAYAYSTQGHYAIAANYLNNALEIDLNDSDNQLNVIEDYRHLGIAKVYVAEYDSALYFLNKAINLNEGMESSLKTIKRLSIADTHLSRAQVQLSLGKFAAAEKDVLFAMRIYEKEDTNGVGMIESTLLLAKLRLLYNKTGLATAQIRESIRLAKGADYKIFRQLQTYADIHLQNGMIEDAVLLRQEALKEALSSNIIPQVIWSHLRLGDAYQELGDVRRANEQYQQARELMGQMSSSSSLKPSLQLRLGDVKNAYDFYNVKGALLGANIATLRLAEEALVDNPADSLENTLIQAQQYFIAQAIAEGSARASLLLAKFFIFKNELQQASLQLNVAESWQPSFNTTWKIFYNRGVIANKNGDSKTAELWYMRAINLIEAQRNDISSSEFKWFYLDDKVDVYSAMIMLILERENLNNRDIKDAFNLCERARSRTFIEMFAGREHDHSNPLINKDQQISREISQLRKIIEQQAMIDINVDELKARIDQLEKEQVANLELIKRQHPEYLDLITIEPVKVDDLLGLLDAKTAMLEFWVGKDNLVAWKVTREGIKFEVHNVGQKDIRKAVSKSRNLLKFGKEDLVLESFQDLNSLISPVFQNVFTEYPNVVVIPHGPLHLIPFEALYDGQAFLLEKSVIQYAPSASVYHHGMSSHEVNMNNNLLGLALGDYQLEKFTKLPGTRLELQQLAQFYDQNACKYEGEISESYFKDNVSDFAVVHIASHGVFNRKNPNRSFILMAPSDKDDGKLTVEEIYDMDISARLVTLSACETGLGDLSVGDELVGLSRAFLYAGATSVIVSLWKVDDVSTSILMTKMYQLINAGLSIPQALTQAQRDLMYSDFNRTIARGAQSINWNKDLNQIVQSRDNRFSSPYYWAPFIVVTDSSN